jgi:hypothetical protein
MIKSVLFLFLAPAMVFSTVFCSVGYCLDSVLQVFDSAAEVTPADGMHACCSSSNTSDEPANDQPAKDCRDCLFANGFLDMKAHSVNAAAIAADSFERPLWLTATDWSALRFKLANPDVLNSRCARPGGREPIPPGVSAERSRLCVFLI